MADGVTFAPDGVAQNEVTLLERSARLKAYRHPASLCDRFQRGFTNANLSPFASVASKLPPEVRQDIDIQVLSRAQSSAASRLKARVGRERICSDAEWAETESTADGQTAGWIAGS